MSSSSAAEPFHQLRNLYSPRMTIFSSAKPNRRRRISKGNSTEFLDPRSTRSTILILKYPAATPYNGNAHVEALAPSALAKRRMQSKSRCSAKQKARSILLKELFSLPPKQFNENVPAVELAQSARVRQLANRWKPTSPPCNGRRMTVVASMKNTARASTNTRKGLQSSAKRKPQPKHHARKPRSRTRENLLPRPRVEKTSQVKTAPHGPIRPLQREVVITTPCTRLTVLPQLQCNEKLLTSQNPRRRFATMSSNARRTRLRATWYRAGRSQPRNFCPLRTAAYRR